MVCFINAVLYLCCALFMLCFINALLSQTSHAENAELGVFYGRIQGGRQA
jgi:hypothetical protein